MHSAKFAGIKLTTMVLGVSTFLWVFPFYNHSFHLVQKVKDMGFDLIEIPVEKKELIDWEKVKEAIQEAGLKVTISGAFGADRDISSEDPAIRQQGLQYIKDCVEIAALWAAPCLPVPYIPR